MLARLSAELGKVGFERALEDVATLGELGDLGGDQTVDARAGLGDLGEILF